MGLLDALKQYWQDASPGGALNPEIPKDAPVLGLLADPMGSIRSTLNKANAQADAHLNKLAAASAETAKTGKWTGPAQKAYQGEVGNFMLNTFGPLQTVWHGSPHKFDKFDFSKIGTGEGAQAYGHGGYVAESPDVAGSYAANLTTKPVRINGKSIEEVLTDPNAQRFMRDSNGDLELAKRLAQQEWIKYKKVEPSATMRGYVEDAQAQLNSLDPANVSIERPGYLYKVDLPDDAIAKMLDWDKPLSQQPHVMQAIEQHPTMGKNSAGWNGAPAGQFEKQFANPSRNGEYLYRDMLSNDPNAAAELQKMGIPGIRYLDGGSRGTGAGTSNFVVFPGNEGLLTILERNGQKINDAPGLLGNIPAPAAQSANMFENLPQHNLDNLANWGGSKPIGQPDEFVKVYRAPPEGSDQQKILPGDWVTANLDYLHEYAGKNSRVIESTIPAHELVDAQTGVYPRDTLIWTPKNR